jgi:hypothetical protein
VSGRRLVVGAIFMGVLLPVTLFFLLGQHTISQFLTIAASTLMAWGVADFLSTILERPRLENRSPGDAFRQDWERRAESLRDVRDGQND